MELKSEHDILYDLGRDDDKNTGFSSNHVIHTSKVILWDGALGTIGGLAATGMTYLFVGGIAGIELLPFAGALFGIGTGYVLGHWDLQE